LLVIPVLAAMIAASCGGGDDDDDAADEVEDTAEETAEAPEQTSAPAEESTGEETESEEPAQTAAPEDEDTEDGSPIVETLPPETVPDPVVGGTLRYGLEADVDGINPTQSALSAPGLMMGNAVFDTLAAITPDGRAVPYLAESFTSNEDFTQWQVKLRPNITFHDGTPLNADAVIVNFEAQRAHPLVGLAVAPFFPETGATEKIDDLTVQFNLLDANAYFPATVTAQLGMVSSPAWLEAALADPTLNQQPVGTGPFRFDSRSQDSVTRFVRNDDWWGGEVYLDAVEFYPVPDPDTRVDLMFGGELDALQTTDASAVVDLQDDESIQNVLDDSGEESFAMINTTVPPFDDIRARQALAYATPRQDYVDLIQLGVNRAADGRFIPESPFYAPDVKQVGDDPDTAVQLATEYCNERGGETNTVTGQPTCTDGKINIELQWSGPSVVQTRIAELLDEGWSSAFNVTFDELLQDEHIQQTALGQYNVNTWRQFGADDPSTDNVWLLCRTISGISLNWPRFCDEERDALLMAAQATTDQAERVSLYQQAEQKINEAFTYVYFVHTLWDNAFAENVHGVCSRTSPEGELLKCASNGRTWFSSVWID
jgi:peptide/nickel transport system substrate-binding protein